MSDIIPYQELSGNYNRILRKNSACSIIPYQELSGNYNTAATKDAKSGIIPYQELSGNYNSLMELHALDADYTIPRTIREL